MNTESVHVLQTELDDWEARYRDAHTSLSRYEHYVLWLRLFRLSRLLMRDYQQLGYTRNRSDTGDAYTGDTQRLAQ